ncbi:Rieske domain-containing protein [Gracilariopsis chorda]|uniref:Rieske domain-containing protein n=1 Tax=Gracilariopsis chorda TaxID=448386 RepID=A0A2V3J5H5_9FLOR|nr:Rieske domain-containing protein [Gracilariopsis chorda]|eukprot:PXF49563.1 Rieske domain-containing protein [Gracilariopsis chorda]
MMNESVGSGSAMSQAPSEPCTSTEGPGEERDESWICVGSARSFGARTTLSIHNRIVLLLRENSKWHCLDAICYHAGGPLSQAAVERVDNRVCLRCPWHSYLIDIEDGHGLYMDLSRRYRSKGARQRVHKVRQDGGQLFVQLCARAESVASDEYAFGAQLPPQVLRQRVQRYVPR